MTQLAKRMIAKFNKNRQISLKEAGSSSNKKVMDHRLNTNKRFAPKKTIKNQVLESLVVKMKEKKVDRNSKMMKSKSQRSQNHLMTMMIRKNLLL